MKHAFAPSTRATYKAGIKRFKLFCSQHKVCPLPADKETVAYFAAYLSRSVTPTTMKLSAISAWHNRKGFRSPTSQNPILKLVIKGAKRIHANNKSNEARRQPITLDVLQTLIRLLQSSHCCLNQHDQRMLQAAFTVAFYGLLRISEFTVPSIRVFDPRRLITMADITWGSQHYTLILKYCKTDQLGRGHQLHIPKAKGITCPFKAMYRYCSRKRVHAVKCAPLFTFKSGEPLTRNKLLTHLRRLLSQAGYSAGAFYTHSFRIGAATTAAEAGLPRSQIKLLGRWRSSAYLCYTRSYNNSLISAANQLANIVPHNS